MVFNLSRMVTEGEQKINYLGHLENLIGQIELYEMAN